jgi:hypothetical protein
VARRKKKTQKIVNISRHLKKDESCFLVGGQMDGRASWFKGLLSAVLKNGRTFARFLQT